jgi:hypothetical protein
MTRGVKEVRASYESVMAMHRVAEALYRAIIALQGCDRPLASTMGMPAPHQHPDRSADATHHSSPASQSS